MSLGMPRRKVRKRATDLIEKMSGVDEDELAIFLSKEKQREYYIGHALDMVVPFGWHILVCDVIRFCLTDGDLTKLMEVILVS